jgi:hypothetical protein
VKNIAEQCIAFQPLHMRKRPQGPDVEVDDAVRCRADGMMMMRRQACNVKLIAPALLSLAA